VKKKILVLAAALMMFMGIVSASSINGDYKGNPIVKVMSNGKQLQSDEVPAQIYDGHTVVPISLLRQLGASVEWNQDTYSVDVKLPEAKSTPQPVNQPTVSQNDIPSIAKELKKNNFEFVQYLTDGERLRMLTFMYKGDFKTSGSNQDISIAFSFGVNTDATVFQFTDAVGIDFQVNADDYKAVMNGSITQDEYNKKVKIITGSK
jgi:hypothetical protein